MKSICNLKTDDRLRLCSAIFDVLGTEKNLRNDVNYVSQAQECVKRTVKETGKFMASTLILPCANFGTSRSRTSSMEFFVLADTRELGAVFVFIADRIGRLELHARVTKIGALLNPSDPIDKYSRAGEQKEVNLKEKTPKFKNLDDI